MERTPEQRLEDELARIARTYAPGRSCQREEIEHAYDTLQTKLHDTHEQNLIQVLKGYERREVDARTQAATAPFAAAQGQSVEQQLETQRFIAALRADIARELPNDETFQAYKAILTQEMADNYEAMLNRHHDHQQELMQARGIEMAHDAPVPEAHPLQPDALTPTEPEYAQRQPFAIDQDNQIAEMRKAIGAQKEREQGLKQAAALRRDSIPRKERERGDDMDR